MDHLVGTCGAAGCFCLALVRTCMGDCSAGPLLDKLFEPNSAGLGGLALEVLEIVGADRPFQLVLGAGGVWGGSGSRAHSVFGAGGVIGSNTEVRGVPAGLVEGGVTVTGMSSTSNSSTGLSPGALSCSSETITVWHIGAGVLQRGKRYSSHLALDT
jgi:hypothetical protein